MSRPKVAIESYEQIDSMYDFYEQHIQSQTFARAAHYVLSKIYRPTVTFTDGAKDSIADNIHYKTRLSSVSNHLTGDDQYVAVAVAQKEKVLHSLMGSTFIPTEPSLSTANWKRGGQLLRMSVDGLGSIPTVRKKDLERWGVEITPEIQELQKYGVKRANETYVAKMIRQANHMFGFPEGERNRVDHTRVQKLKKGIAITAINAAASVPVVIVPWGMYYGGEPTDYKKLDVPAKHTPHVHIGMPISVETTSADELTELMYTAIQDCVDVSVMAFNNKAA